MMRRALVLLALVVSSGCATFTPWPSPVVDAPASVQHLQQTKKVIDVVKRVGLVAEQVQIAEIAMFRAGDVPPDVHQAIQRSFLKTANVVLTSLDVLKKAPELMNPDTVLSSIVAALKELLAKFDVLAAERVRALVGWLETAVALVEVLQ